MLAILGRTSFWPPSMANISLHIHFLLITNSILSFISIKRKTKLAEKTAIPFSLLFVIKKKKKLAVFKPRTLGITRIQTSHIVPTMVLRPWIDRPLGSATFDWFSTIGSIISETVRARAVFTAFLNGWKTTIINEPKLARIKRTSIERQSIDRRSTYNEPCYFYIICAFNVC